MKKRFITILCLFLAIIAVGGLSVRLLKKQPDNSSSSSSNTLVYALTSENATVKYNTALPSYVTSIERKGVSYAANEQKGVLIEGKAETDKIVIKYNSIINIAENTKDIPLIEFFIGAYDTNKPLGYSTFRIRLTDAYDEDNFITISVNSRPDTNYPACVRAGTASQKETGCIYINKQYSDVYGTNLDLSFDYTRYVHGYKIPSFSIDYAERKVYCFPMLEIPDTFAIKDLDDTSILNDGETAWNGFTNGECYLSIELDKISTENTNICPTVMLFSINGKDL